MSNIVVPVLSITIGLFFLLVGTIKLTPYINEEFYKEMRKMFIKFARVFPLASITGWKPNPHVFRRVFGVCEVVSGLLLAFIPGPLKQVANIVLLVLMCLAIYSHYAIKDTLDKMTSEFIFGLLLACRFIVRLQVNARNARLLHRQCAESVQNGNAAVNSAGDAANKKAD